MNLYQMEFEQLKPYDPVQFIEKNEQWDKGYLFIVTAGHGYLIVPKKDKNSHIAKKICKYGFIGNLAYYLEKDIEAGQFLKDIN